MSDFTHIEIQVSFYREDGNVDVFKGRLIPTKFLSLPDWLVESIPDDGVARTPELWLSRTIEQGRNLALVPFENRSPARRYWQVHHGEL